MTTSTTIAKKLPPKTVRVPDNFAPLSSKKLPGYFVDLHTKNLFSIKWGYLHQLAKGDGGGYNISNNGIKCHVNAKKLSSVKRPKNMATLQRVP